MGTEVNFKWNKPIPQIAKDATKGDRAQLFMANEAKRLMDPFVPAMNLVLAHNVRTYVEGGHGVVHYVSPYAHFQHEGYLMVSRITGSPWASIGESKVTVGRKLQHSTFRHPLATSEWDQAMKAARMDDLTNAVQRYINGGR